MTSKSIYDDGTLSEFMTRVENLKADAVRQWGTMNVSQMLAHCSAVFEAALGDKPLKRSFIGLVFGRMAKPMLTNDKPFKQNIPTDKGFIVTDTAGFDAEKKKLLSLLTRFSQGGPATMENRKHPFFGTMTAKEWSTSQVKHLDHHLRQFGA